MKPEIKEETLQRTKGYLSALKSDIESGEVLSIGDYPRTYKTNNCYSSLVVDMGIVARINGRGSAFKWLSDKTIDELSRKLILKARRYAYKRLNSKRKPRKNKKAKEAIMPTANPVSNVRNITSVDQVINLVDIAHRYGVRNVNAFVSEMMNGSTKKVVLKTQLTNPQ